MVKDVMHLSLAQIMIKHILWKFMFFGLKTAVNMFCNVTFCSDTLKDTHLL